MRFELLRAGKIEADHDRQAHRKAGKRLRDRTIPEVWIRADERAAVWAERQAIARACARTPEFQSRPEKRPTAPLLSALVPLVVPDCGLKRKKYEFGDGATVQPVAVVLKPSSPLPPFVVKSPLATNSVTADTGELVSNNSKAVPVHRDLNVEIMANSLICNAKCGFFRRSHWLVLIGSSPSAQISLPR